MSVLIWGVFTFCLSVGAVALYARLATRLPFIDRPNERSAHAQDTLSSGGLAVIAALGFAVAAVIVWGAVKLTDSLFFMLLPTFLLCAIGAIDDWRFFTV